LSVKIASLVDLIPTMILILLVLGTIYARDSPRLRESAALGVVGSIVFAAIAGKPHGR
jgi:TRAP-type mannitol/chloroaromatic compound transport system permease large subunit